MHEPGAYDYFVKTTEEDRLLAGVSRAVRMIELQRENFAVSRHFLANRIEHPEVFASIITENKIMLSIFQYLESVVRTSQPILIRRKWHRKGIDRTGSPRS